MSTTEQMPHAWQPPRCRHCGTPIATGRTCCLACRAQQVPQQYPRTTQQGERDGTRTPLDRS
jgi:hypothetical protein